MSDDLSEARLNISRIVSNTVGKRFIAAWEWTQTGGKARFIYEGGFFVYVVKVQTLNILII